MGNQQLSESPYQDSNQWTPIARTSRKELLQHKLSRRIVEKHLLRGVSREDLRHQTLIFDWRKDPRTALSSVQLLAVVSQAGEGEASCMSSCQQQESETDLLVYTERIYKLYQQHPEGALSETEQLRVIRGVVDALDLLSQRFGEFAVSKEMVGFNLEKQGKAWVNDNFCLNVPQQRRPARSQQQRMQWELQSLEDLVAICQLGSADHDRLLCKFQFAVDLLVEHRFSSFEAMRRQFVLLQEVPPVSRPSSQALSGETDSSGPRRASEGRRVKIFSGEFAQVPGSPEPQGPIYDAARLGRQLVRMVESEVRVLPPEPPEHKRPSGTRLEEHMLLARR